MNLAKPFIYHLAAVVTLFIGQNVPEKQRRVFIVPATLLFWQALYESRHISATSILRYPFAMTQIIGILNIPIILATNISKEHSPIRRIKLAHKTVYNPRMLPVAKRGSSTQENQEPLRGFLKVAGIRTLSLIALDVINSLLTTIIMMSCTEDHFSPKQVPIVRRILDGSVTLKEMLLRLFITLSWLSTSYITLSLIHMVLSVFFVAIVRTDRPDEWPPLYGNLSDAYTIQRFWGKTWHRLFSRAAVVWARTGLGVFVVLNKRPKMQKFLSTFLVFMLSAMAHMFIAASQDEPEPHLDFLYFMANFLGVVLEILTTEVGNRVWFVLWGRGPGMRTGLGEQKSEDWKILRLKRSLGYVWVILFFSWLSPRLLYPKIYHKLAQQEYEFDLNMAEW